MDDGMKDGVYVLRLSASEFESLGSAVMRANHVVSDEASLQLSGTLFRTSRHAVGTFNVRLSPDAAGNRSLPRETFALTANGPANQTEFDLVGAGPLGLIVSIVAEWKHEADSPSTG
jgi:hypothetical protein